METSSNTGEVHISVKLHSAVEIMLHLSFLKVRTKRDKRRDSTNGYDTER